MRVSSLIILIVIIVGAAYVYMFQWDRVTAVTEDVRLNLAGYTAAKTPEDAMDRFAKAIKARDYSAAARYCTKDYADNLLKGKKAGYEIAYRIDMLKNLMVEKPGKSDRAMVLLLQLDPFPSEFQRSSDKKVEEVPGQDNHRVGWFKSDIANYKADMRKIDKQKMDPKMMSNVLAPRSGYQSVAVAGEGYMRVALVGEGEGDNRTWKIDFGQDSVNAELTRHLNDEYRKYVNVLDFMLDEIRKQTYASPGDFADDLQNKLANVTRN